MQRDAVLTPVTLEEMAGACDAAWLRLDGTYAPVEALFVVLGHSAMETGFWASMRCHNMGNAKSTANDGRDFCYYAAGEELPAVYARQLQQLDPVHVRIVREYALVVNNKTFAMASVALSPPHWMTRFRAFGTLEDGVADHLAMLRSDFSQAWAVLRAGGDVAAYVRELKAEGYFTLDEPTYLAHVRPCVDEVRARLPLDRVSERVEPLTPSDPMTTGK